MPIGMGELVVILVIVLILFGAKKVPEVARGLGKSLKAFKQGMNDETPPAKTNGHTQEPEEAHKK